MACAAALSSRMTELLRAELDRFDLSIRRSWAGPSVGDIRTRSASELFELGEGILFSL